MKSIKIETKVNEENLIECLLNYKHSNFSYKYIYLLLTFHAFASKWDIDKITYYIKLLELDI